MFDLYDRLSRGLTRIGYWVSVIAALGLMIIGGIDVLSTHFLHKPVPAALELQEVLLVVLVFMGLSHAQHLREHITVDVVVQNLPPGLRRFLDLLVLVLSAAVFAILSWRSGELAWSSVATREAASATFAFPIYPAKALVSFGAAIASLECIRQLGWWFRGGEPAQEHPPESPELSH